MRIAIATATLVAVGASAIGVSALDIRGSDTLKDMTVALLTTDATCGGPAGGGSLVYVATGSSNGQSSLVGNTQDIAPMSRPLFNTNNICTTVGVDVTKAEHLVFALDAISIVANVSFAACAGSSSCGTDLPASGLRFSGVIPGTAYSLTDWKDALRILYFGYLQSTITPPATTPPLGSRNCNGAERNALVSSWNNLFQACASASCPAGLRHAFRRNDESGTTDTFVSLIGAPSILLGAHISPFCNVFTKGNNGITASGGAATQTPVEAGAVLPTPPLNRLPTINTNITVCSAATGYRGEYFTDFQDGDPIRRACGFSAGLAQEDVCAGRGDLGVVLPIWDAPNIPEAEQFPTADCSAGLFTCTPAQRTSCAPPNIYQNCPNGHNPNVAGGTCPVGQCATPVLAIPGGLDPRCNSGRGNNAIKDRALFPPPANTGGYDGRVHNLVTWTSVGGGLYAKATVPRASYYSSSTAVPATPSVAMVGSFHRIHAVHSLVTPNVTCQTDSATDQIGCLVRASPCSIGFAGNSAVQGNTIGLGVNNVAPIDTCVRNLLTPGTPASTIYPISRKLYLSTTDGFETLAAGGDQRKLAECFANGKGSAAAAAAGFVTLPGGAALCEDFDEATACGTGFPNVNACANNVAPFPL